MQTKRSFRVLKDISLFYHPVSIIAFSLFLILVFLAINPKYSTSVFPFKRKNMLNSFITSSIQQNKINAQEFWELREFYAPGVITVNKTATITPFLNFKSSKITSQESLIPKYRQDDILPRPSHNQQVDFRTKTDIIYHDSQTVHIVFVKPISEMVTANAVYDYKDKDKKFLEGKLWFVEMTINTQ